MEDLASRFVKACIRDDLVCAKELLAEGASVNDRGWGYECDYTGDNYFGRPLYAAVVYDSRSCTNHDLIAWLLLHGADPNDYGVMAVGMRYCNESLVQLLLDAGGDINRKINSDGDRLLDWVSSTAYSGRRKQKMRVLLDQPSLRLTVRKGGEIVRRCFKKSDNLDPLLEEEISRRADVSQEQWRRAWEVAAASSLERLSDRGMQGLWVPNTHVYARTLRMSWVYACVGPAS